MRRAALRLAIPVTLALAGLAPPGAGAQPRPPARQPNAQTMGAHAREAPLVNAQNADAYARQQAFDARVSRVDRKAIGSICDGCERGRGGARSPGAGVTTYGGRDPAQAPLD